MITKSERVTDEIAGVLMGVILAGLLYLAMGWLWSDMRLPVVIIFLVFWIFASVDTMMLRHQQLLQTFFLQWVKPSEIGKRRAGLSPSKRIWGDIATVLLGAIVSLFVAGLLGKWWPPARWPGFFVLFLLWSAIGVIASAAKRRDSS